MFVMWKSR